MTVTLEVLGMTLRGHHGVLEEERREGQPFVIDLTVELSELPRQDRIEQAVDYRDVASCAREVFEGSRFHLLETLAAAIADALIERFSASGARVRIAKPDMTLAADGKPRVSVERSRSRSGP